MNVLNLFLVISVSFVMSGCASMQVWEKVNHPPHPRQFDGSEAIGEQIYLSGFTRDNFYRYRLAIPYKVSSKNKTKDNAFPPYKEGIVIISNFSRYTSVMPFLSPFLSYSSPSISSLKISIKDIVPLYRDEYYFSINVKFKGDRQNLSNYINQTFHSDFMTYFEDILYDQGRWLGSYSNSLNNIYLPRDCRIQDNNNLYHSGYTDKEQEHILKYLPNDKLHVSFHRKGSSIFESDKYKSLFNQNTKFNIYFEKEKEYGMYKNSTLQRTALTPFAIVFDVVTAPIQALTYLFLSKVGWH